MKRVYALVVLLVLTSVYSLADSIIPNVTPMPVIAHFSRLRLLTPAQHFLFR